MLRGEDVGVTEVRAGVDVAFAEFYAASFQGITTQLYAYTGDLDLAHDLAQEAFCRALARWSTVAAYDDPAAWVRRVGFNLANSRWRRLKTAAAAPPQPRHRRCRARRRAGRRTRGRPGLGHRPARRRTRRRHVAVGERVRVAVAATQRDAVTVGVVGKRRHRSGPARPDPHRAGVARRRRRCLPVGPAAVHRR